MVELELATGFSVGNVQNNSDRQKKTMSNNKVYASNYYNITVYILLVMKDHIFFKR